MWGVKNVFKIDDLAFQLHFKCDSVNQFILLNKRSVLFFLKLQNCPNINLYLIYWGLYDNLKKR